MTDDPTAVRAASGPAADGPVADDPAARGPIDRHAIVRATPPVTTNAGRHGPTIAIDRLSGRRIVAGMRRAAATKAACRSGSTHAAWQR